MNVILITGSKQSGKTTMLKDAVNALAGNQSVAIFSLSQEVKRVAKLIFPDLELMPLDIKSKRVCNKESLRDWECDKDFVLPNGRTSGMVLQDVGKFIHDTTGTVASIVCHSIEKVLACNTVDTVIIDGLRYEEDFKYIRAFFDRYDHRCSVTLLETTYSGARPDSRDSAHETETAISGLKKFVTKTVTNDGSVVKFMKEI